MRRFTDRDVTDAELTALIAAAQSASTSSNLQPWSVVAVRDPQRKARLSALAANQAFIAQAPLFLVWVADLDRARRLAGRAGAHVGAADYLETTLIGFVDTALAAQNAVVAAESLGLGAVFVGAIRNNPEQVAAELACRRTPWRRSAWPSARPTRQRRRTSSPACPRPRSSTTSGTTRTPPTSTSRPTTSGWAPTTPGSG
ncbi:nitroreductase family protein [Luedemannella flava]